MLVQVRALLACSFHLPVRCAICTAKTLRAACSLICDIYTVLPYVGHCRVQQVTRRLQVYSLFLPLCFLYMPLSLS